MDYQAGPHGPSGRSAWTITLVRMDFVTRPVRMDHHAGPHGPSGLVCMGEGKVPSDKVLLSAGVSLVCKGKL